MQNINVKFQQFEVKLSTIIENTVDNNQTSCLCVVFVFRPSEPRPHFSQQALCTGRVTRAVFAPRDEPLDGCEESSQWLNRSQLYFLTHNMVGPPPRPHRVNPSPWLGYKN
jgi:hypothetical protein